MSILDPTWRYRPSFDTNVARTVRAERKRLAAEAKRRAEAEQQGAPASVSRRVVRDGVQKAAFAIVDQGAHASAPANGPAANGSQPPPERKVAQIARRKP